MVRAKIRKHLYWHDMAKMLLEQGLMPTIVSKVIKTVYPEGEITGRHVGAYKRRLINDGLLEKNLPKTMSPNEAYALAEDMTTKVDTFVYNCSVGSAKRSLKCFEYKLTEEIVEHDKEVDVWLNTVNTIDTTAV
jgi:hypothetical protein